MRLSPTTCAYVALSAADAVAVVDLARGESVAALTAGKEPDGMAYSQITLR